MASTSALPLARLMPSSSAACSSLICLALCTLRRSGFSCGRSMVRCPPSAAARAPLRQMGRMRPTTDNDRDDFRSHDASLPGSSATALASGGGLARTGSEWRGCAISSSEAGLGGGSGACSGGVLGKKPPSPVCGVSSTRVGATVAHAASPAAAVHWGRRGAVPPRGAAAQHALLQKESQRRVV
eukprot:scaffold926_cov248-Pinguiococcus_pyrenoidosus.AAC.4